MSAEDAEKSLHSASTVVNPNIYVTNISDQATLENLVDFFTYCGPVKGVTLYKYFIQQQF